MRLTVQEAERLGDKATGLGVTVADLVRWGVTRIDINDDIVQGLADLAARPRGTCEGCGTAGPIGTCFLCAAEVR